MEKKFNINSKYPWWVLEEEQCLWCNKSIKLLYACVTEDNSGIEMCYICENLNCEHLKTFRVPNKMVFTQGGKKSVEVFIRKEKEANLTGSFVSSDFVEI